MHQVFVGDKMLRRLDLDQASSIIFHLNPKSLLVQCLGRRQINTRDSQGLHGEEMESLSYSSSHSFKGEDGRCLGEFSAKCTM
ncbi:hypothetical protein RRG08_004499 [Elysia crispata]|uniref:Uncharacterized protein n=1 Tax=Elysia crispata TaxID=231223 RepID=A0AAE1B9D5_9GAST|nr:hypothetical protein RRG08_004499 [Elysia crispata]